MDSCSVPDLAVTTLPVGGLHLAHLEPMTGMGFLVLPMPGNDLWLGGSLNGSDWDSAVRALSAMGWEPLTNDDGTLIEEGVTSEGRPVVALVAVEPVVSEPSIEEYVTAQRVLADAASLVGS